MKRADIILQNSRKFWHVKCQGVGGTNERENVAPPPRRSERKTEVSRRLLFNSVSCFCVTDICEVDCWELLA